MEIREYSDVALRALEYWERGHRRQTKLRARLLRELRRRDRAPELGQVPGLRGARAALRVEREAQRQNR